MYILDFSANQPKNTKYITEIKIKFKQIREAEVLTVKSKFKSQGAEIAANKKYVEEAPSYLNQEEIPLPEEEYRLAGDFVKQTLNIAQRPFIITRDSLAKVFTKVQTSVAGKVAGFSNISTAGMNATEVTNAQVLMNNMSTFPMNGVTTNFMPKGELP
jgi:L-fucose isomerase-like protein